MDDQVAEAGGDESDHLNATDTLESAEQTTTTKATAATPDGSGDSVLSEYGENDNTTGSMALVTNRMGDGTSPTPTHADARGQRLTLIAATSARVAKELRFPKAAKRLALEGEVLVRCALIHGRWVASIARSSGVEHFDIESLRATRAALQAVAADDIDTASFVVPVRFRLTDRNGVARSEDG